MQSHRPFTARHEHTHDDQGVLGPRRHRPVRRRLGREPVLPLLLVYRAQLHLSAGDLGLLFGLYAVGLIPGLLIGGPASDRFGRRRLVLPFVALSPVATALTLLAAHTPVALGGARFLAGVCSGVVFAAGGAWLQELSTGAPAGTGARRAAIAMSAGFGAGPLVASLLAQFAPDALRLPYLPHLALGIAAVLVVARVPETPTTGAKGRFLRLPSTARLPRFRRSLVPLAPWVFGSAALAMVVLPALVTPAHSASVAFAGITTAVVAGAGVLVQPLARSLEERRRLGAGAVGLAVAAGALVLGLVATVARSEPLVVVAAVPFGMAYGMCLVAGLRETERLAPAHERGASIAIFLALSYLGFGAPYAFDLLEGAVGARASLIALAALAAATALATPLQRRRARVSRMTAAGRSGGPGWPAAPKPLRKRQQADERLRVVAIGDGFVQAVQRPAHDLDALVGLGLQAVVAQAGGLEQVEALVGEAGRGEELVHRLPVVGGLADLLGQLALRGLQRLLARLVELARRDLEQVGQPGGLARLAHEPDHLVVVGDDPHRAGVAHDLARLLGAVRVPKGLAPDREDPPLVDLVGAGALEARAHATSSPSSTPPASADVKNASSSLMLRPMVVAGSPDAP